MQGLVFRPLRWHLQARPLPSEKERGEEAVIVARRHRKCQFDFVYGGVKLQYCEHVCQALFKEKKTTWRVL